MQNKFKIVGEKWGSPIYELRLSEFLAARVFKRFEEEKYVVQIGADFNLCFKELQKEELSLDKAFIVAKDTLKKYILKSKQEIE